jgi:hypothetical protein
MLAEHAPTTIRRPTFERRDPDATLVRAVIAQAVATLDRSQSALEYAARAWPHDGDVPLVLRAAVAPNTLANSTALVPVIQAMVAGLQPLSASGELMARGIQVTADGGLISVPSFAPGFATFVGEAAPIPVRQLVASGPVLSPFKVATILTVTEEMLAGTNAEPLARAALLESIGPGLDAVMFSNAAATANNPAGLFVGVAAIPAVGTMAEDLTALLTALGPAAGAGVLFIAALPQAAAMAMRAGGPIENVRASAALSAGEVVAVATQAFVSMLGVPRIDSSIEAVLHMDDAPAEFATGGVVAAPGRSLFQTATTGLKMVTPCSWATRSPTAVAHMTGVNW